MAALTTIQAPTTGIIFTVHIFIHHYTGGIEIYYADKYGLRKQEQLRPDTELMQQVEDTIDKIPHHPQDH